MDPANMDERFRSASRDPRFRAIRQKQRKIKLNHRFQHMLTDEAFQLNYDVDKRGKPIHETSSENLKKFYRISNKQWKRMKLERKKERESLKDRLVGDTKEELKEDKTLHDDPAHEKEDKIDISRDQSEDESSSEYESDDTGPDLARGEGNIESSSEEEEEVELENLPSNHWSELDMEAERSENISKRLALCNMDWDKIKAVDLLILFDSFKPNGGFVKCVTIYPSDYGVQRMAEENLKGPAELKDDEVDGIEGKRFKVEKLREHEINRLKYYYAVIECDSEVTADAIYKECDGLEYETSSSKLDIRFVPDDLTFDDHPPKDVANQIPDKDVYNPPQFVTKALNQSKVDITWDETDHKRLAVTKRHRFTEEELAGSDFNAYLASSSGEDEELETNEDFISNIGVTSKTNDADSIARYRNLLLGNDLKDEESDDVDMEMTLYPDILEHKKEEEDSVNSEEDTKEEVVATQKRSRKHCHKDDTPVDPQTEAELEMLMMDPEDMLTKNKKHFDMKQILEDQKMSKRKRRKLGIKTKEDDFEMNTKDPRFSKIYSSHDFALDPNASEFRKTKGMLALLNERQERIAQKPEMKNAVKDVEAVNGSTDLTQLINSVKSKTNKRFVNKILKK